MHSSGAFRSIRNQVSVALLFKGFNALAVFFIMRLALNLSGDATYGFWVTILSTITWFSCIEVGISSGIRNRITTLTESEAPHQARAIIGSAMTLELLVYAAVFLVALIIYLVIPDSHLDKDILGKALLFGGLIFLSYVFSMVNASALANHRSEWPVIITFVQNVFSIIGLLIALRFGLSSLLHLGLVLSSSMLTAFVIGHVLLYYTNLAKLKPRFPDFDFSSIKPHFGDMWRFGVIQFFVLIIFASDHLIILQYMQASDVTDYNVTFRYFNLLNVLFNLLLIPFWSAFTSAQQKQENAWANRAVKILVAVFGLLTALGVIMLLVSSWVYQFWLGDHVMISGSLSIVMLLSVLLTMWNYIFVYYLSGIGQIRLYSKLVVISGVMNIPISILMVSHFGTVGVIAATCIALLPQTIFLPIEALKFLRT